MRGSLVQRYKREVWSIVLDLGYQADPGGLT
jgi:hypothetical protein